VSVSCKKGGKRKKLGGGSLGYEGKEEFPVISGLWLTQGEGGGPGGHRGRESLAWELTKVRTKGRAQRINRGGGLASLPAFCGGGSADSIHKVKKKALQSTSRG